VKLSNATQFATIPPSIYEREYQYWPWGKLIDFVADWVIEHSPEQASLFDYMCGTGYLLNRIAQSRPDVTCAGCCIDPEYVEYARRNYSSVSVALADSRNYAPACGPDIVLCTAGLHHLHWDEQGPFLMKIAEEMPSGSHLLVGEQLIQEFSDEQQRRSHVLQLWFAQLDYLIANESPPDMIRAAVEVLGSDLLAKEFKVDEKSLVQLLERDFVVEQVKQFWPGSGLSYGDFLFICRRK